MVSMQAVQLYVCSHAKAIVCLHTGASIVYFLTMNNIHSPSLCSICFCPPKFTKDVVAQLNSVKIDLRAIILLEAEGKQNLLDFSEAGLLEINYADYLEEVIQIATSTGQNTEISNVPWHSPLLWPKILS